MVLALFDPAQPERTGVLVGKGQADHLSVERLARSEVLRCEYKMACARDVERRPKVGLRQ
jgi:hypothetical protein